ncbi:hypothetical protein Hgul01_00472 [Herpetosiphon gulosus]|uniref:Uncharacterized protein n=1 Tax=Herpetosiphon gulosus TaxID=1973496 RepID=A0ABP9WUA1_9CHLR
MVMIGWFPLARVRERGLGGEGMAIDSKFHPIIVKNLPLKAPLSHYGGRGAFGLVAPPCLTCASRGEGMTIDDDSQQN